MGQWFAGKDRTCDRCGEPLTHEQERYCSRACANVPDEWVPPVPSDRMPTDDELWEMRNYVVVRAMADRLGMTQGACGHALNKRGWRKGYAKSKRFITAPCKCCGESTPMDDLSEDRVCASCRAPAAPVAQPSVVEMERRRRMPGGDRHEAWRAMEPCYVVLRSGPLAALQVHRGFRIKRRAAAA